MVELIVVIAILAILVGLLAPQYTKYVEKSRKSGDISNLENLVTGLKVAASDHEYKLGDSKTDVTYVIAITDKGARLKKGDTVITSSAEPAIVALKEYSGYDLTVAADQKKLVTKSKKWSLNGVDAYVSDATSQIYATVKITAEDSVTVEYSANVTNYSAYGTITPPTGS